jgi:hypothetical protein
MLRQAQYERLLEKRLLFRFLLSLSKGEQRVTSLFLNILPHLSFSFLTLFLPSLPTFYPYLP